MASWTAPHVSDPDRTSEHRIARSIEGTSRRVTRLAGDGIEALLATWRGCRRSTPVGSRRAPLVYDPVCIASDRQSRRWHGVKRSQALATIRSCSDLRLCRRSALASRRLSAEVDGLDDTVAAAPRNASSARLPPLRSRSGIILTSSSPPWGLPHTARPPWRTDLPGALDLRRGRIPIRLRFWLASSGRRRCRRARGRGRAVVR